MLGAAAGVRENAEAVEQRDGHHAGKHVRRRPQQDREKVHRIEARRRHGERAGRHRHEGADRRYEAREEHRPDAPALKERLALRDHARIIRQRPGRENFTLRAMAGPECGAVADQRAGNRREQHPLQLELAARHQRAQGQNDGRARDHAADDRNGFQQGREKKREIGKPGIRRHECNQWIDIGGHKIPALVECPAADRPTITIGSERKVPWEPAASAAPAAENPRDSQGSLPKTASRAYLDEITTEL